MFSYSGFGTAGIARSDTDQAEYVIGNQMSGARGNFDYKTDSKLGLQGTFAPTEWLSATLQALTRVRDSGNFTTQMEWAYLKVQPTRDLAIRYGKLVLPTFVSSDSENVGYANMWLRSPDAVYGESIYNTYEGGDIAYTQQLGKYSVTGSVLIGAPNPATQLSGSTGASDIFTGHHMSGYSLTANLDPITLHASVVEMHFRRYVSDGPVEGGIYDFYDWGAVYDHGNVFAQGEFIELRTGDPDDNVNGWYVMGAYRLGKWLPYVIYAADHKNQGADGAIAELNGDTISVGVRFDVYHSVDLKAQMDHVKGFDFGTPFINQQPGFDNRANIFSLVVDFVF